MRLRDVVVIAVDGASSDKPWPYPRELAIAFGSQRPGLAWLIMPDRYWRGDSPPESTIRSSGYGSGNGLHPSIVVRELSWATKGCRLFAEEPCATTAFLGRIYARLGEPPVVQGVAALTEAFLPPCRNDAAEALYLARSRVSEMHTWSGSMAAYAAYHRDILVTLARPARR